MIISRRQTTRYVPEQHCDAEGTPLPDAPTFLIRTPTYEDLAEMEALLEQRNASRMPYDERLRMVRFAVFEHVSESQQQKWADFLDQGADVRAEIESLPLKLQDDWNEIDLLSASFRALPEDEREIIVRAQRYEAEFGGLEDQLRDKHPPLATAYMKSKRWTTLAPIYAARMFVTGWENIDVEYRSEGGLIPSDVISEIPRLLVIQAGAKAMKLSSVSKAEEKNSDGPTQSEGNMKPSTAMRKAHGNSTAKKSSKTPSSASQAGAGD
jgi:hypothetical protein